MSKRKVGWDLVKAAIANISNRRMYDVLKKIGSTNTFRSFLSFGSHLSAIIITAVRFQYDVICKFFMDFTMSVQYVLHKLPQR
jgi:hypothetical protein